MFLVGKGKLTIIYDGECPFCTNYSQMSKLQSIVPEVLLLDARSNDPITYEAKKKYNLNDGMLALYDGKEHFGSDAIVLINSLTHCTNFNKLWLWWFKSPGRAKITYPVMKFIRNLTLIIRSKSKIE